MPKTLTINVIFLLLLGVWPCWLQAQNAYPLQHDLVILADKYLTLHANDVFSVSKPYTLQTINNICNIDSAWAPGLITKSKKPRWINRKLFHESLFFIKKEDFYISLDPLLNLSLGYAHSEKQMNYFNSRGIVIRGNFFNKIFFSTAYVESQARFPDYITDFVSAYQVVPGHGKVKNFKNNGFDYGTPSAYISYAPTKHFNIQLGNEKQFIGDGYRSLLLSDNSFPFPSLKVSFQYKWFFYQNIFAYLQHIHNPQVISQPAWYKGYRNKPASFHLLGFKIGKKLDLGLFESTIFQLESKQSFNYNMLVPVILVNTFRYANSGKANLLLGATINYRPWKYVKFYGQAMIDQLDKKQAFSNLRYKNNWGFQLGGNVFSVFGIDNLNFQLEYNQVQPYSYANSTPFLNYAHYNQALAHPLGANFRELVFFCNYRYKRLFSELQLNVAQTGWDIDSIPYGQSVFTDFNILGSSESKLLQGLKTNIVYSSLRCCYLLNPKTNLQLEVGYALRYKKNDESEKFSGCFLFGIKTPLSNFYADF